MVELKKHTMHLEGACKKLENAKHTSACCPSSSLLFFSSCDLISKHINQSQKGIARGLTRANLLFNLLSLFDFLLVLDDGSCACFCFVNFLFRLLQLQLRSTHTTVGKKYFWTGQHKEQKRLESDAHLEEKQPVVELLFFYFLEPPPGSCGVHVPDVKLTQGAGRPATPKVM